MFEDAKARLKESGVVPVVVINDVAKAAPLAEALLRGGLSCAEVTFRTDAAEESIGILAKRYPEMMVGAGTVLSAVQAGKAIEAGASFIVAPGFDPELVDYCIDRKVPVFPGCATASEITMAVKRALDVVKFFPAEQLGGVAMIKALGAPFKSVSFMPTGGISAENLSCYLNCDNVLACGGSWMVKSALVDNGRFDEIEGLVRQAVDMVKSCRD